MTRAAVWYAARDVRVVDVQLRAVGPGEVAIMVAYCGICGSDLHEYVDGPHTIPVNEPHPESGATAPIILGHEFCGTVVEVAATIALEDVVRDGFEALLHGGDQIKILVRPSGWKARP